MPPGKTGEMTMSMPFNVLLFFASAASAAGDGFAANKRNRAAAVWLASEEAGFAVATIPTRRGRNGKSHSLTFRGDARTIFPPILYPPLLSSCLPNPLSLSLPLYVCASSPFCLCLSLVPALLAMCPFSVLSVLACVSPSPSSSAPWSFRLPKTSRGLL